MLSDLLLHVRDVRDLPPSEARLARGIRLWVMLGRNGRCPMQAVAEKLGSVRAAAHLQLLLVEVGAAWPDPFCIAPFCCPRLSHDEALALDMVRSASLGDRPAFDRLLQEMLPADIRDRLYVSAGALGRTLGLPA
ncbi:MAG TPA: addiction module antidote protein [Allosphingosinicella sp.]|nr:addiction module antidote protein [Allosphingosinicella sp.]